MVNLNNIQNIYMLGIGGIGMSALARYFVQKGKTVSGYDLNPSSITRALEEEGIAIHYEDNISLIPEHTELTVYTPAVPSLLNEYRYIESSGIPLLKRSEVLEIITRDMFTIAVAGTHGKTTITTMIAHILRDSGYGCNAFLGGISSNYNTNYWSNDKKLAVVEADEYDKSFLKLKANIAIISSMDADHLEIYGGEKEMKQGFRDFIEQMKEKSLLILNKNIHSEFPDKPAITYSAGNLESDVYACNITRANGGFYFDVHVKGIEIKGLQLYMPGTHNLSNMTAAIAVAVELGVGEEEIKQAVAGFKGVKRRFEYVFRSPVSDRTLIYIDDYAHHPEELKAFIEGLRNGFPGYRMLGIFQPHLFSRTRDYAEGFAKELDKLDEVILLPVYPARELPIEGVGSHLIQQKIKSAHVLIMEKEKVPDYISKRLPGEDALHTPFLVLTIGAGNIETLREPLKTYFETISENTVMLA